MIGNLKVAALVGVDSELANASCLGDDLQGQE
jgi:hypothetical protein